VRRRGARAALGVAAVALVAAGLAGCTSSGGGTITASAVFSDVSDLVAGAPVQFADITVGQVRSITLDGDRANVVLNIDRGANVPADVTAQLQQTTILGEHYVALVAPAGGTGAALADGARIGRTTVVPGIQQLVSSGSAVFGAVNAAQLAQVIDNGAQGFGGQSAQLRQLLDEFATVLQGYASRSSEIKTLVSNIDQFSATLAPSAGSDAEAVSNLAQTSRILAQQANRFVSLVQSLDNLAVQGRSILDTGVTQTEDQINALSAVAQQLAAHQQDLAKLLLYLPGANETLASVTVNNFAQVLDDVIVCGIPGGGSNDANAAATCAKARP
jgi:phospholipid/cholesterol/gamma-HCH transport system substrate-binding protein